MPTYEEVLAELLRQLDSGAVSQADVARRLDIPAPRVNEIKKGKRRIQQHELAPLANFLGMVSGYTAEVHDIMPRLSEHHQRLLRDMAKSLASDERI